MKWWVGNIRSMTWFAFRYWWFLWLLFASALLLFYFFCGNESETNCNLKAIDISINRIEENLEDCCDCNEKIPALEIPDNETIICIAIIDETVQQTQNSINTSWSNFRSNYPNRPFYILRPEEVSRNDVFYFPRISPDNYEYIVVNRDNGDSDLVSDWFDLLDLNRLPENSKIALFLDVSGSMTMETVEASYNRFINKTGKSKLIIESRERGDENYIEPFIYDFSF